LEAIKMSLLNKHSTRKLIIVVILFFICIFVLGKFYLDHQTRNAFIKLSEKNISKILIYEMGPYTKDDYVISSKREINLFLDYLIKLEKDYVPVKDFLSWDGKYSYSLNFEKSQSPQHYTQLFIHGVDYMTLRIYNHNDKKYQRHSAKITIDEDEIKALLSK
jgi:hypothetical protein